ncbi:phosphotransferase enzyme family protein [Kibdelosporangium persicum]|uniref:Aminoglycoside phosphotransferase domain-containing protein n=1 Tax=Kibdelosporangium persicum TaxID=2698649 RepID=A0ABX2FH94_9PSEU|nr:aminoglycoside phosphotransferase family protein [Kibdelosporangium persicum]NRN70642.1 hypothetical protein [Kibdelosporangium persicum]
MSTPDAPTLSEWKRGVTSNAAAICRELPHDIDVSTVQPVTTSSWNALLRVGSHCVKVMNEATVAVRWTLDELDVIGRTLAALKMRGYPYVLPPVRLHEGRYAARCAGYTVMVYPWCSDFASASATDPHSAFADHGPDVLCELHRVGQAILAESNGAADSSLVRRQSPARWIAQSDQLWQKSIRTTDSPDTRDRLQKAQETSHEIARRFPGFFAPADQDATVLHGDFRPENVLVIRDEIRLVHDFDFMRPGWPEEDVAYAALYFSGPPWFAGPREWARCIRFVAAYNQAARKAGCGGLRREILEPAMYWVVLRELSLSFELPAEVAGRCDLLDDLAACIPTVIAECV